MKFLWISLIFMISVSTQAAPGKAFTSASCESYDSTHQISLVKQTCQDARYQTWNSNGCYRFKVVDSGNVVYDREMLRDHTFRETQQGYYTIYSYDQDTWIEVGIIVELDGKLRFSLSERGSSREVMVLRRKGTCELTF